MLLLSLVYLGTPFDEIVFTLFEKLILTEKRTKGIEALELVSLAWSEKSFGEGAWAQTPAAQAFLQHLESLGALAALQDKVTSASTSVRFKALVERSFSLSVSLWFCSCFVLFCFPHPKIQNIRLCLGTKSLWRLMPCVLPDGVLVSYTEKEQLDSLERCRVLRKKAASLEAEIAQKDKGKDKGKHKEGDGAPSQQLFETMRDHNREISARMLGVELNFFHDIASVNMLQATQDYIQKSETYDPEITNDNLVQAARNVWTCYALQLICHQTDAVLSNAILGYSLLYPYTDNYLDDTTVEPRRKYEFQQTFGGWLEGDFSVAPTTPTEQKVFDQVRHVESTFDRTRYPNVFHSLTAINDAQTASLSQHGDMSLGQLLSVTVYKGGTSVLADLFMSDGNASDERDILFSFLLGVCLQLIDDLQDVIEDSAVGHNTVFTRSQDQHAYCDLLVIRIIRLLDWTAHPRNPWSLKVTTPAALLLRTQMLLMCNSIVMKSIAQSSQMFSAEFIEEYKRYAPVPLVTLKNEKSMKHLLGLVRKNAI